MMIAIGFRPPLRLWQSRLAKAIRGEGHDVLLAAAADRPRAGMVEVAVTVQQLVLGPRPSLFDRMPSNEPIETFRVVDIERLEQELVDVLIVLDGTHGVAPCRLEPLFDGAAGDRALVAMVARGATPNVQLQVCSDGSVSVVVDATLAIEDRDTLSQAVDQVLARVVTLTVKSVRQIEMRPQALKVSAALRILESGAPLKHMARGLLRKIAGRLPFGRRGPNHWRVGFRYVDDASGIAVERAWPKRAFTMVPDDGRRFYADPMPLTHGGRSYVFLEEYVYATGKGVISCLEVGEDMCVSAPRVVLEQPCHLSYPFIVRHEGEIYMLPEMSGAGRLQLFRAVSFPDHWVGDRILLDGVVAADATLVNHAGRWWMFASLSDDGGSSWDQLCLFHAPDLFGPWVPHADNPVLVDAGAARPAGAMWHEDGVLMRVAQDCREGYGKGLAICRVDRLDEHGYVQTLVGRLGPPDGSAADGVHTIGRHGSLEVIDLRYTAARR